MEEFISTNGNINSRALREFETRVANELGLKKRANNDIRSPLGAPIINRNNVLSSQGSKRVDHKNIDKGKRTLQNLRQSSQ